MLRLIPTIPSLIALYLYFLSIFKYIMLFRSFPLSIRAEHFEIDLCLFSNNWNCAKKIYILKKYGPLLNHSALLCSVGMWPLQLQLALLKDWWQILPLLGSTSTLNDKHQCRIRAEVHKSPFISYPRCRNLCRQQTDCRNLQYDSACKICCQKTLRNHVFHFSVITTRRRRLL